MKTAVTRNRDYYSVSPGRREMDRKVWKTQNGEHIHIKDMTTNHLFFSCRMMFNHNHGDGRSVGLVPDGDYPSKKYNIHLTEKEQKDLFKLMIKELFKRNELTGYFLKWTHYMHKEGIYVN